MASKLTLFSALLASHVFSQQTGTGTPEVHPLLPSWECTVKGGCVQKNTSVVLDSDYRWVHASNGANCKTDGLNSTLCPDAKTCSANCALEGVDYTGSGVVTSGSELTLHLFVNRTTGASLASPRVYLLANETTYDMFSLLNKEFTFDVDVSKLPCGTNGALYFSEMEAAGGRSTLNPAGAEYGTGYCDAQCPSPPFINGEVRSFSVTTARYADLSRPTLRNTAPVATKWTSGKPTVAPRLTPRTPATRQASTSAKARSAARETSTEAFVTETGATSIHIVLASTRTTRRTRR